MVSPGFLRLHDFQNDATNWQRHHQVLVVELASRTILQATLKAEAGTPSPPPGPLPLLYSRLG